MSPATTTTITGNLTRDPEIRYTREGQATTSLGVAVNRRWQNRETNEWEESTSFFDVVTWRDLAENVALSLTKGMRGPGHRPPRAAQLGDRGGRSPLQGGDRGRRGRRQSPVRHRRRAQGRAPPGDRCRSRCRRRNARTPRTKRWERVDPDPFHGVGPPEQGRGVLRLPGAWPMPTAAWSAAGRLGEADALGDLFLLLEERLVAEGDPAPPTAEGDPAEPTREDPGRPVVSPPWARTRWTASSRSSAGRSGPARRGTRGRDALRTGHR